MASGTERDSAAISSTTSKPERPELTKASTHSGHSLIAAGEPSVFGTTSRTSEFDFLQLDSYDQLTENLKPSHHAKGLLGWLDPFRQRRYRTARKRWAADGGAQRHIYDSPLQEASLLLRELAISLEAAKDTKRLAVVCRVITLLQEPNLYEAKVAVALHRKLDSHALADATLREWLGRKQSSMSFPHARKHLPHLPRPSAVSRSSSQPGPQKRTWRFSLAKASLGWVANTGPGGHIAPADETALHEMLERGIDEWCSPAFDSNELDRFTGGNALVALGSAIFERHNWAETLRIRRDTMQAFLIALQAPPALTRTLVEPSPGP